MSLGAGRGSLLLVVAIGGVCSVAWVLTADAGLVWQQARAFAWWVALPAVALTLANVLLRLIRWQFFLRRSGIRLPMRQSAGIFVAGLAMLLTPAYAGEGVKTWLVARAGAGAAETAKPGRAGWARAAGSVVAERLFDAMALCLVGGGAFLLSGEPVWGLTLGGAGLLGVGIGAVALRGREVRHLVSALLLSLLAWLCGCLTLYVVCRGVRLDVTPLQAVGTYSAATLLGGLTLLPAGVGVVGTAMLIKLQGYGASLEQAVLAAVLVRLLTVWLTAALGVAGCWHLWWQQRRATAVSASHFDALAPAYAGQLSATARDRVVARKVELMLRSLRGVAITPGARLLDAGCGHGWYIAALTRAGYHVTGVDLAPAQLAFAGTHHQGPPPHDSSSPNQSPPPHDSSSQPNAETLRPGPQPSPLATASVLALPFPSGTFDAAFAVNVLHHAGDGAAQDTALDELSRVVRPGGLIFVHEISTVNPLYRLYMAYLFPLWKQIDLGTEFWLDPRLPPRAPQAALESVRYFTFLPDFTPRALYHILEPLEQWLERSRWAPYAAHFTAIYRRRGARVSTPHPAAAAENPLPPHSLTAAAGGATR